MMTRIKYLILAIGMLLPFVMSASVAEEAMKAYADGDYQKSVELFQNVIGSEGTSASALYDLGNAYYKAGDSGMARLCYERALKLAPGNSMIKSNLSFVSDRINDLNNSETGGKNINVYPDEPTFMQQMYGRIAIDHNSNGWAVLAVISFLLFLGGLALYMFTPIVLARKTGFFSGLFFLAMSVVFLIFSYLAASHYESKNQAILIEYTSQLLQQPLDGAQPISTRLHKGTKVEILEQKIGNDGALWYKVRLNSDNIGWVKSQFLEVI